MKGRGALQLDAKLIAAWSEIPEGMQKKIRAALKSPTRVGAHIPGQDRVKTALGYAVHSGFVTGLAVQMIEAVEWSEGAVTGQSRRAPSARRRPHDAL